jgi:hypothetical protein
LIALGVLLGSGAAPALVSAQGQAKVPMRQMLVRWTGRAPLLTFSAHDFVDDEVEEKLKSGLPQRIVTRVYAYRTGGDTPLSVTATSCRVVYDLWEGVYRVQLTSPSGERAVTATSIKQVTAACLDVTSLALGNGGTFERHAGRPIYFAALIELNPLARDTLQRIRRWLSRSGGSAMKGDAFFGSFVSTFVSRRLGSAERTMTFRSRVITVPR